MVYASDRYGVPFGSNNGTEAGNFNGPGETKDDFGKIGLKGEWMSSAMRQVHGKCCIVL